MRYDKLAGVDLDRIWIESAKRFGSAQADTLIDRIHRTLAQTLGTFPSAGRPRPELGEHVRSYAIVPYVAFYRVNGRHVDVLRILHGHRNVKAPLVSLLVAG
jgi:toxin ParE1/3/4